MKSSTYSKIAQAVNNYTSLSKPQYIWKILLVQKLADILAAQDKKFGKQRFLEECNR